MAEEDVNDDPALARKKLIELLENDKWRFTDSASQQGRATLKAVFGKTPSDYEMIEFIVERLRAGFPILRTPMGEPPGSGGIGWVMNNPDGNHTYIKLKIEQDGVYDVAWVISCKTSKHHKPT